MTGNLTAAVRRDRPIEEVLAELATPRRAPIAALKECMARCEETVPILRGLVALAAVQWPDGRDITLLQRGLLLLASRRDRATWKPLLRLLRKYPQNMYSLYSCTAPTLLRILDSVFDGDGDTDLMWEIVADRSVARIGRALLLMIGARQVVEARVAREPLVVVMRDIIKESDDDDFEDDDFEDGPDEDDGGGFWNVARLFGAFALARTDPDVDESEPGDDDGNSGAGNSRPDIAVWRTGDEHVQSGEYYVNGIEDIVRLLGWDSNAGDDEGDDLIYAGKASTRRATNFWRDVGRNDPCPCGSGLKAKKCCWNLE